MWRYDDTDCKRKWCYIGYSRCIGDIPQLQSAPSLLGFLPQDESHGSTGAKTRSTKSPSHKAPDGVHACCARWHVMKRHGLRFSMFLMHAGQACTLGGAKLRSLMAKSNKVPALLRVVNLGNTNRLERLFHTWRKKDEKGTLYLSDLLSFGHLELQGSKQKGLGALAATVGALPSFAKVWFSLVSFTLATLVS